MLFRSNDTAYEIPLCDLSSDVCSSDLHDQARHRAHHRVHPPGTALEALPAIPPVIHTGPAAAPALSIVQAHRGTIPADPFKVQAHQAIPAVRISQRAASAG